MDNYFGYTTQQMGCQLYPQQHPQQTGYTQYTCAPYTTNMMVNPAPICHKTLDKLKHKKTNKSISAAHCDLAEEFASLSTDESIHLVRSRRANAANQALKKRSQSGTSLLKGMASQLSVPRSQSDERSLSPAPTAAADKRKTRKEKSRKPNKSGSFASKYDDGLDDQFTYSSENRLIDAAYFLDQHSQYIPQPVQHQFYQQQQQQQQPQQQQQQPQHMSYGAQYPSYQQQYYQPQQHQHYAAAPGAPCDYYNQSSTQNFQATSNPSQSYYQQADAFSSGTQTFHQAADVCSQNLPNGAKIVAEYFLGYLDEQQQYQQQLQQQQQQQMSSYQPQLQQQQQQAVQYPMQYQQSYEAQCPPGCQPVQVSQCPPGCVPEESYSSGSEVNREEVEIEIWEKAKREKKSRRSNKSCDDFKKLTDIIETLE